MKTAPNPKTAAVIQTIRTYRKWISPLLGHHCRFFPSCSEYAEKSFQRYGLLRGFWLSVRRLSRCHPFNAGGYDPPV